MNVQPQLPDHPKFVLLKEAVGSLAAEYLLRLWGHCAENRRGATWPKPKANPRYVEIVCRWAGEPGKLYDSLVACGWLEDTQHAVVVHDWETYNGKMVTAWENSLKGGRKPVKTQRSPASNPNPNSVPTSGNPNSDSVPEPETETSGRYHLDRIGSDRIGTKKGGEEGSVGSVGDEPVIPTAAEVVEYGKMGGAIPPDYCADFHASKTIARTWLNFRGELIDWRRQVTVWWAKNKPTWDARKNRGRNLTALAAIEAELDYTTDVEERARLKKRRAELSPA